MRRSNNKWKWKPSKSQKRAFAQKMANDKDYANEYNARKELKREKNRATSIFDYSTAGGWYMVTEAQFRAAEKMLFSVDGLTSQQLESARLVHSEYLVCEKVHHDHIHVVNEWIRSQA